MTRNYDREYALYQGTPEQIARRSARNKSRRDLEKKGMVRKGDGKDVDHKDHNPMNRNPTNLRAQPKSVNRSFPRLPNNKPKR
jgi:hypothetical protein